MSDLTFELLSSFAAASHCASPGSTPPLKGGLSASSLLALTQSPLLSPPSARRKRVQGKHKRGKARLDQTGCAPCLPPASKNKIMLCWGLGFGQKTCDYICHCCVQCLNLTCLQETWYELGSLEGEVAMKRE